MSRFKIIKEYFNDFRLKLFTILVGFLFTILSCSKEGDNKPSADFTFKDEIDKISLLSSTKDEYGSDLSFKWSSESQLITINNSYSYNGASFKLPSLDEPTIINIKLVVCDGQLCDSVTKGIEVPNLTEIRRVGLGSTLQKGRSNNVDYEWYIDQYSTGPSHNVNCGPTAATMAIKWVDRHFNKTVQDARDAMTTIFNSGEGWYTGQLTMYLALNSINYDVVELTNTDSLIHEIDKGNIIILCLDMYYIRTALNLKWHLDRYFNIRDVGAGHAIIIKGYKVVDDHLFFEIYDPDSENIRYTDDNMLIGKDRYYRNYDINSATDNYWDYYIVVSKNILKRSNAIDQGKIEQKIIL